MDGAVALWILVPLALVHILARRNRALLLFQIAVDVGLVLLPGRPLLRGMHVGPGVAGGAPGGGPGAGGGGGGAGARGAGGLLAPAPRGRRAGRSRHRGDRLRIWALPALVAGGAPHLGGRSRTVVVVGVARRLARQPPAGSVACSAAGRPGRVVRASGGRGLSLAFGRRGRPGSRLGPPSRAAAPRRPAASGATGGGGRGAFHTCPPRRLPQARGGAPPRAPPLL